MKTPRATNFGRNRPDPSGENNLSLLGRRFFLAGASASLFLPRPVWALNREVRALSFDSLHTGERLTVEYWAKGEYLPDALIPFAGSRHSQSTTVSLGDRATFFWWELLAPGRQAMVRSRS